MPGRNIVKQYAPESYYHVYSRGVNKQTIFRGDDDYAIFLSLLKRYLGSEASISSTRHKRPNYHLQVELLAFALMGNHIHLMLYQKDATTIAEFMKSLMTSYSMYFNKKYSRVGPLFQSRYRAVRISSDSYLQHISRYIHLNPREWEFHPYTSIKYYRGEAEADWVNQHRVLNIFLSKDEYMAFLHDYKDHAETMEDLRWELADQ